MITVPRSLGAALGLALFSAALHGAAPARPNLLFILTEDQGAHLSFLGTPGLRTPHMDALARSGMYFEQAFVAYPVCSASKAAIYTGLHNHSNGLLNNTPNFHKPAARLTPADRNHPLYVRNRVRENLPTLVERLHAAGYYQGVTSKLHVAPNEKFPYDEYIVPTNHTVAARFIARAHQAGKPWHLFFNVSASHRPYPNSDKVKIRVDPAEVKLPAYLPDTPVVRQDWAEYLAAIERTDAIVGEGLAALRESGAEANTIVVFLGDHGPPFPHGKMTLYDLGLRTPLIIRAPGAKNGVRRPRS
jgi:N-sulfoglucosamine sulfohydrolase